MEKNFESDISFSEYFGMLRKSKGISIEALAEGLCQPANLMSWESGRRTPDQIMQERILSRLGAEANVFYRALGQEEYDKWHLRTRLLCAIQESRYNDGLALLKEYEDMVDLSIPLEEQFCLTMRAMILSNTTGSHQDIYALLDRAIKLTVPDIDNRTLNSLILSSQELDMLLDRNFHSDSPSIELYEEIIGYSSQNRFEFLEQLRIFPKAVVLLCQLLFSPSTEVTSEQLSRYVVYLDTSLDILRKGQSFYYLWEILKYRNELYTLSLELGCDNSHLSSRLEQNHKWLETIESLYAIYDVPKETTQSTITYITRNVECLNAVIRTRRKMLGLTPPELSDGICSPRTLQRIENGLTTPQQSTANELLKRLNLPCIGPRCEVFLANHITPRILYKFRNYLVFSHVEDIDSSYLAIRQNVNLENTYNAQFVRNVELYSLWSRGIINSSDYLASLKEILEMTLPLDLLKTDEPFHLTDHELTYLINIITNQNPKSKVCDLDFDFIESYYNHHYSDDTYIAHGAFHGFILDILQNYYGNNRNFDKSNELCRLALKRDLERRYLGYAYDLHYSIWWNENEQKKKKAHPASPFDSIERISECAVLCDLFKINHKKDFFTNKLYSLT